ncbi:pimeloyl-ACP methyl ester carboxylesterase [Streptacidiphilus sp. MAP12-20]|uniref:alpha/beta fold hydrolase n=1 Tax=Streptacidiphilus sp. MAP12-20 TaxID=3156299 RepID=UPI003512000A
MDELFGRNEECARLRVLLQHAQRGMSAAVVLRGSAGAVAGADHAINPDAERAAAQRIGATVTVVEGGSHAIALSRPDEVTQVILTALQAVAK